MEGRDGGWTVEVSPVFREEGPLGAPAYLIVRTAGAAYHKPALHQQAISDWVYLESFTMP